MLVDGEVQKTYLVSKLVSDNVDYSIPILLIRRVFVEQHGSRAIGNETPVLHGTV